MDFVHSNGVLVIQHLQKNYREYQSFVHFMSSIGDPRNIFLVYFPLWFPLSHVVGTKIIWVAVIGDFANLIFKWILFGHRPYWWVQETQFYQNSSHPHLEQFPITCETGPGSPSGHAMCSSCVWYLMVTSALRYKDNPPNQLYWVTWSVLWTTFWVIQISVCISRVFIATHFPHQVVLGVFAGMLVAEVFQHMPCIQTANLQVYLKISLLLLSTALSFYLTLKMINVDLLWSVTKARKWCANPEWVHLDSSPFAGLVRNLGVLFGLGLGINSQMFNQSCKGKNSCKTGFKVACMAGTLAALQLYEFVTIPTQAELLFYVLTFCKSSVVPLTVVAFIPYIINLLMGSREEKSK
ncbi:glucose-6-phosphatase 2-like [Erpetoichthys calabaricus]|uniref:Glucose-6-phosphatase n=1 Tax=Erpetoichthys calabaricus TaxID=27687 RepID=A0A8C4X9S9_ERPCA|nr:glucose-6-phosphatase 2-like [Erpetoichthys calabaricus]